MSSAILLGANRFFSLLLVALTLRMTFCHVLEMPGKLRLDGAAWLTVHQNLYVAFGIVGASIELVSILLTRAVAAQVRRRRPAFAWTVAAGLCVTAGGFRYRTATATCGGRWSFVPATSHVLPVQHRHVRACSWPLGIGKGWRN